MGYYSEERKDLISYQTGLLTDKMLTGIEFWKIRRFSSYLLESLTIRRHVESWKLLMIFKIVEIHRPPFEWISPLPVELPCWIESPLIRRLMVAKLWTFSDFFNFSKFRLTWRQNWIFPKLPPWSVRSIAICRPCTADGCLGPIGLGNWLAHEPGNWIFVRKLLFFLEKNHDFCRNFFFQIFTHLWNESDNHIRISVQLVLVADHEGKGNFTNSAILEFSEKLRKIQPLSFERVIDGWESRAVYLQRHVRWDVFLGWIVQAFFGRGESVFWNRICFRIADSRLADKTHVLEFDGLFLVWENLPGFLFLF